jgi:hypothetical protein
LQRDKQRIIKEAAKKKELERRGKNFLVAIKKKEIDNYRGFYSEEKLKKDEEALAERLRLFNQDDKSGVDCPVTYFGTCPYSTYGLNENKKALVQQLIKRTFTQSIE